MLQPRRRKFALKVLPKGLLLRIIILLTFTQNLHHVKGEDEKHGALVDKLKRGERVIRHGDVNIVVIDDLDRRKVTPPSLGLLSTTARTFIQEGTTTEYATHVYGTTLGDKYAHIVSTGSTIFYDGSRLAKGKVVVDPIITIPSLDELLRTSENNVILPSKVAYEKQSANEHARLPHAVPVTPNREETINKNSKSLKPNIPSVAEETPLTLNAPPSAHEPKKNESEMGIRPAKVKPKNELPTFTVKQDSSEMDLSANQVQRSEFQVDNVVRVRGKHTSNPIVEKPPAEWTTTTYFGFADFVTTAGNTIIVFTPKTARPNFGGNVTMIHGEATLRTASKLFHATSSPRVTEIHATTVTPSRAPATNVVPPTTSPTTDGETEASVSSAESTEADAEAVDGTTTTEREVGPFQSATSQTEDETTSESEMTTTNSAAEMTTESGSGATVTTADTAGTAPVESVERVPSLKNNNLSAPHATQNFETFVTTFFLLANDKNTTRSTTESGTSSTSGTTRKKSSDATTQATEDGVTTNGPSVEVASEKEETTTAAAAAATTIESSKPEEEVELIFKTLYTTYTYLTTYFEKSSTSVKSREEVVTNVVTSTLDNAFLQMATDPAVAGLFAAQREAKVLPPKTAPSEDNEVLQSSMEVGGVELSRATPSLNHRPRLTESSAKVVRTSSTLEEARTSSVAERIESTPVIELEPPRTRNRLLPSKSIVLKHSTIKRPRPSVTHDASSVINTNTSDSVLSEAMSSNSAVVSAPLVSSPDSNEPSPKRVFVANDSDDDQLSLESNTEEAHPSPSLVALQTSYTTYTYFTTIYKGSSSSEIISRLETVTNVNTELVKPSTVSESATLSEESTAPVTYYTTFTYWTTFYKDGSTMIKSRQETVSNVITPTLTAEPKSDGVTPTEAPSSPSLTTFTYYTTSYSDNTSVVNSRLETVSNVVNGTSQPAYDQVDANATTALAAPDSSVNKHQPAHDSPREVEEGTISLEEGRVVDAFGISTTFYSTRVIGTRIEQLYAQVIESTSSVKVNREHNTNLISPSTVVLNEKIYQTGVLQLREGSIVRQGSTTFYTTKIVGSVIDNEYTSITETHRSVRISEVTPTAPDVRATSTLDHSFSVQPTRVSASSSSSPLPSPSATVIESSMSEITTETGAQEEEEEAEQEKSSRRKPPAPVIRPFDSRSRPKYFPKKKSGETSGAATITRGITPTIVAIPALKTADSKIFGGGRGNRFAGGIRKSSVTNTPVSEAAPSSSSTKRFSRTKPATSFSAYSPSSAPSSIRASSPAYKRGSYRLSTTKTLDYLSQSSSGSRFKVRPTLASGRFPATATATLTPTTPRVVEDDTADLVTEQVASSSSDEEVIETAVPPSTTESSRKSNPLLRFRKPGTGGRSLIPTTSATTSRPAAGKKAATSHTHAKSTTTKPPSTTTTTTTTTTTKVSRARTVNYGTANRVKLKSPEALFPGRTTSRKPDISQQSASAESVEEKDESDEELYDKSEELVASENPPQPAPARTSSAVPIKPVQRRGRTKRQTEWGYKYESTRGQNSRYRRPTVQGGYSSDYLYYDDTEYTTEDLTPRRQSYSKSRGNSQQLQQPAAQLATYQQYYYQQTTPSQTPPAPPPPPPFQGSAKIRPSNPSGSRSQFTLREKSYASQTTTPVPQRSNRRTTRKYDNSQQTTKRPSVRQRTYTSTTEVSTYRNNRKQSSSRRTTARSRYKDTDYGTNTAFTQPVNDGSITVTYKVPTEVTIPVVSGKVTEYKNVVTAKPSIQVLASHQYSTVTGKNGLNTLQLVAENTETMQNGLVEVTRYVIQELPTTSVTWTPTTIRGRKTSFSHIVPSTVYEVKPEVSTVTPQLNANAPLANLLLSQLLLGNLGLQQTANPLLGLNQQPAATPVTEYKTRTTSYITTITHSTSAVIPVTFRGKEIKTTIVDSSVQVITATEFITDTVVVSATPTLMPANNPLRTLLLPALLQAQLLGQPQPYTAAAAAANQPALDENLNDSLQNVLDAPTRVDSGRNEEDYDTKKRKGKPFDSPVELTETSVVTLYLSGRKPGEFSTVLSTVTLDEDKSATLRKRNVEPVEAYELKPSVSPSLASSMSEDVLERDDYLDAVLKSGMNDLASGDGIVETESLESILGDVSNHLSNKRTNTLHHDADAFSTETSNNPQSRSNHFLLKVSAESAPFQRNFVSTLRSLRYRQKRNAHTVNGVPERAQITQPTYSPAPPSSATATPERRSKEKGTAGKVSDAENEEKNEAVIKIKTMDERYSRPYYSSSSVDDEGRGRYNLATKVMSNGVEVIVALDKSTLPGSPQLLRVLPTSNIRPITFTPHTVTDHMIMMLPHGLQDIPDPFITKTYLTTYTYLTTMLEDGVTTTSSEEKVISNVFTENIAASTAIGEMSPGDVHVTLDSSPIMATKVYQTTYNMKTTIQDGENTPQIVTNQQTVSNTITAADNVMHLLLPSEPSFNEIYTGPSKDSVNEEFVVKPTEQLAVGGQSVLVGDDDIGVRPTSALGADITKTYFVTYTYFSTLLESGSTVVKSNVATSSDVVTEKYYSPAKRTKYATSSAAESMSPDKAIQILATKTYLTTYTYFTTLLQDKGSASAQTVIRSRTKVMQNLVTETLNPELLNADYLSSLKSSLRNDPLPIVATATLSDGQRLEITAINEHSHMSTPSSPDYVSSSFEQVEESSHQLPHTEPTRLVVRPANENSHQPPPTVDVGVDVDEDTSNGAASADHSFATTTLQSATVMKNGATLLAGSQVIQFTDPSGNVSMIPVSDPVSKHPSSGLSDNKLDNKLQMTNNLLNFGQLGINSLSALKPVLSAMAGLWQNGVKSNVKDKYETHVRPPSKPYLETNQIELNTKLKPPSRTPIYIPVGSVPEDNEEAGSEDHVEQYPDVNQRNNQPSAPHPVPLTKPVMEKPLVSGGGIPISPGQVITANTDVIVGTPAVLGPRPPTPVRNSLEKSDIPVGMKPPPIGQTIPKYSDEDNRVVSTAYKFEDIVKIPPKPLSPAFSNNAFQLPPNVNKQTKIHHKHTIIDQKIPMSSEIKFSQLPFNTPLSQPKEHVKEYGRDPPPAISISSSQFRPPPLVEPTSLNPLLVDVRPSQMAQVIIPADGQNAFVYTDESAPHGTRGEIINDPIPYPEENVNPGFVGLKVFGPNANHAESTKLASNTIHLDIPINPYVEDGTITESHHFVTLNLEGKPVPAGSVVTSVLRVPDDVGAFKRPNSKYNFTIPSQPIAQHPYPYQPPERLPQPHHPPYIFPQKKPIDEVPAFQYLSSTESDYNAISPDMERDQSNDYVANDNDGLTQETRIKPSSDSVAGARPTKDTHRDHDGGEYERQHPPIKPNADAGRPTEDTHRDRNGEYELHQKWEILKENPTKIRQPEYNHTAVEVDTTQRYGPWTSIQVTDTGRDVNKSVGIHDLSAPVSHQENTTNQTTTHRHNAQDDVVIGLSPPPLPPQTVRPTLLKLPRPTSPKLASRPSVKTKPKPTSPPYPFEKPTPSPVPTRPRPIINSKPPPNILYETDPPNVDELMKLKPLNTTARIEPVKKVSLSNSKTTLYGNITKVQGPAKEETKQPSAPRNDNVTNAMNNKNNNNDGHDHDHNHDEEGDKWSDDQSNNNNDYILDKTTELISKWNEYGIITSSKVDLEENEYHESTRTLDAERSRTSSVPNTVFGILNTRLPPANVVIIPTAAPTTTQHYSAISVIVDSEKANDRDSGAGYTVDANFKNRILPAHTHAHITPQPKDQTENSVKATSVVTSTYYITHTKTLSPVTVTQTTVIHKDGGQPSTRTIVQTTVSTTTIIDTVTKTLQPTNVLATVTTTVPFPVTKEVIPTKVESSLSTAAAHGEPEDADSILVVMTDKKGSPNVAVSPPADVRPTGFDVQVPDEANEISPNDILYSGIYTQHSSDSECRPECKVTKNEMCQKIDNNMKCVCRPGFARMFPDHPCRPTYTYQMKVPLERQGNYQIHYTDGLADRTSPSHQQLTEAAREGLHRMVMQSNLHDIYHDIVVAGFEPTKESDRAAVVYVVRLSENAEETKLQEEIHKTLKANNFSLGGTDMYAASDMLHSVRAEDFDECTDEKYHDCSENAQCFNLRGTYTCSCKEGFTDMSYSTEFPGRICSADLIGCETCNYHGTCYYKTEEEPTCECFQWYAGEFCQVNLKVTLITLIAVGVLLSILLIMCLVMTCNKQKPPEILRATPKPHVGFRRYRSIQNAYSAGDKRAIVSVDTSSEGSIERTPPPFVKQRVVRHEGPSAPPPPPPPPPSTHHGNAAATDHVQCTERDRSLTVLIPRAKYRPVSSQPSSTLLTMSTFGPEQKLLNYAASREDCRTPEKKMSRCSMHSRKLSNSTNLSTELLQPRKKMSAPTRPSSVGALVSAGFEVSATVRRTQELDEAYVSPSHNDLNTYNSIRTAESSIIVDVPSLPVFESSLEDFISRVDKLGTVSEARSYDETTIHPPMRSLHHIFHNSRTHTCDSKHSSSHKDEHHTMGERDLGSTYMPKSQLYKPDHRESDDSNFDSL